MRQAFAWIAVFEKGNECADGELDGDWNANVKMYQNLGLLIENFWTNVAV